jgi:hypothetical protein
VGGCETSSQRNYQLLLDTRVKEQRAVQSAGAGVAGRFLPRSTSMVDASQKSSPGSMRCLTPPSVFNAMSQYT